MTAREPRYSTHKDPVVAEVVRDVRDLAKRTRTVEEPDLTITTDAGSAMNAMRVRLKEIVRPKSVMVGRAQERTDQVAIPALSSVRWDFDASRRELVIRGIGGLGASKTYLVTLRVEGE